MKTYLIPLLVAAISSNGALLAQSRSNRATPPPSGAGRQFSPPAVSQVSASPSATPAGPAAGQVALLPAFRPIGGVGNNLVHPRWDAVPGSAELAIAPLNFARGTINGLVAGPNPRLISTVIAGGTGGSGQDGETNDVVTSAWMYVFGQFVDHDISLESTPPSSVDISIIVPQGDPVFTPGTRIFMTRDERAGATNTIVNTVAGYLDLSQLYGCTTDIAALLRNADGTLVSSGSGQYLQVVNNAFITGDPRVMENPELSALSTLFMREHNRWVATLRAANPGWSGDQLYNMAKAITTAEYQNIIYTEFLPLLIGPVLGPYEGYNSNVNAQATQEFTTAAFRAGHSQVSDTQEGLDNSGNVVFTEPLSQAFQNTAAVDEANGVDALLRSLGADYAQATDVYTVATLRNLLFAPLPGGDTDEMDLMAIDIQRERDAGIATLNKTRAALGMPAYTSFAEITSDPVLQQNLQAVYGSVDALDLFIGGLAENHAPGAEVGPTFQAIIAGQFSALRAGDRFFWQNEPFDPQTAAMIANTRLADIIRRNTDTAPSVLQPNVFIQAALGSHVKMQLPPPVPRQP